MNKVIAPTVDISEDVDLDDYKKYVLFRSRYGIIKPRQWSKKGFVDYDKS